MRKGLGNDIAARLHLQSIVANHRCCAQRFVHITAFKKTFHLRLLHSFRVIGPYTCQTICLKLQSHRRSITFTLTGSALDSFNLIGDAE